jgi:hypothetical protein
VAAPDFEISTRIRAKTLAAYVPPDAQTEVEDVTLARDERRSGVSSRMEAGALYSDVAINKRILGVTQHGQTTRSAPEQAGHDGEPVDPKASDAAGQRYRQHSQRSSSHWKGRGTGQQLDSRKQPPASDASSPSRGARPVTDSLTGNRLSAEPRTRAGKGKNLSPRSLERFVTTSSSSSRSGLAEAFRSIMEGATILREVRRGRRSR